MRNYFYGFGILLFVIGAAGLAEAVEGSGSFLVSAIVFSVGLAMTAVSYVGKEE